MCDASKTRGTDGAECNAWKSECVLELVVPAVPCVDGSEVLVGSVPYGGLSGVIVYISIDLLSQLLIDMRNLLELRRYEWSTPLPVIV